MPAVANQPGDGVGGDCAVAVLSEKLQAGLEDGAGHLVQVKHREQPTGRTAEEKGGIAASGQVQHTPQRAAAFRERNAARLTHGWGLQMMAGTARRRARGASRGLRGTVPSAA